MAQYKIIKGSLMINGAIRGLGQTCEDSEIKDAKEELLRDGKIAAAGTPEVNPRQSLMSQQPKPPGLHNIDLTGRVAAPAKPQVLTSKWNSSPEGLDGKDLPELNSMIVERDSTIAPFDTREEAVAWLCQDYKAE